MEFSFFRSTECFVTIIYVRQPLNSQVPIDVKPFGKSEVILFSAEIVLETERLQILNSRFRTFHTEF